MRAIRYHSLIEVVDLIATRVSFMVHPSQHVAQKVISMEGQD